MVRNGATSKLKVVGGSTVAFVADGNPFDGDRIPSSLGTNVSCTRDGQGRITRISGPSGEKRTGRTRVQVYGVDPNAVAESSGGVDTRFTFGVGYDAPLAMQRGGVASFFAQDALSSVTSLTNSAGAVSGRYSYDTYGQIKASSGTTASPYTYTGREWDSDAGIYEYRARQYDPATGRFLSEVPIATSNLYAYAAGVPTLLRDPSGRTFLTEIAESQTMMSVLGSTFYSTVTAAAKCDTNLGDRLKAAGGGIGGGFGGAFAVKVLHWLVKPGFVTMPLGANAMDWAARAVFGLLNAVGAGVSVWIADELATGEPDPEARARGAIAGFLAGAAEVTTP